MVPVSAKWFLPLVVIAANDTVAVFTQCGARRKVTGAVVRVDNAGGVRSGYNKIAGSGIELQAWSSEFEETVHSIGHGPVGQDIGCFKLIRLDPH
jgi:hypothetical protein